MSVIARVAAVAGLTLAVSFPARAADPAPAEDWTSLPDKDAKPLIETVRKDWRARSGETIPQMLARLKQVINFTPRHWYAELSKRGPEKGVTLMWVRKATEAEDDRVGLVWNVTPTGPVIDKDDRLFALSSSAFALNAIQQDVDNEEAGANVKFLRDPKNLNFVDTPHGKLGDLLAAAQCTLINPTYVLPVTAGWVDKSDKGFVRLQITVNCVPKIDLIKNPDAIYHFLGALVAFKLVDGEKEWIPTSFLAARIWQGTPGHWADVNLPIEDKVFEAAKYANPDRSSFRWMDVSRVIELRNSGRALPESTDDMHASETVGLLRKIENSTSNLVTPAIVEVFLRHAGLLATTMSDQGIIGAVPMFANSK